MKKDIVIKVENLGKRYQLGGNGPYLALRDSMMNLLKWSYHRLSGEKEPNKTRFWALKNVSFEVKRGEILGIIGKNGAGKTTLLKILSRITEPTTGRAILKGRVASLLEVGTGFHPELTGRENIYLNGCILGMKKREIDRKFKKMVEFSGIEKFIDMPVKRYSSGMYVRLAFSVTAHLDPKILLIDEVLAVGDLAFREKCFRRMRTLREAGVTILLVSHSLAQVSVLAHRCLWLDEGQIRKLGRKDEVIAAYSNELRLTEKGGSEIEARGKQKSTGKIEYAAVRTVDKKGNHCNHFKMREDIIFEFDVRVHQPVRRPRFGMGIYTHDGVKVLIQSTRLQGNIVPELVDRDGTIRLRLSAPPLLAGKYTVQAVICSDESDSADYASWSNCHTFSILVPKMANANHFVYTEPLSGTGLIRWDGEWQLPWLKR